jgi:biofilm PGA synthesis N-glycosyltransferase PgaC
MLSWDARGMWLIYLECLVSIVWSYLISLTLISWCIGMVWFDGHEELALLVPTWTGMLLSLTCLAQFAFSLAIDSRYERQSSGMNRYYYWLVWYPLIYWVINVSTTVIGFMRAVTKKKGQRALWITVDRGLASHDPASH